MTITPEDKDWTWILERRCPECGFDAPALGPDALAAVFRDGVAPWRAALAADRVRLRPDAHTWSPLEYGAHLRDALGQYRLRVAAMVERDGTAFADWDQDAAAVEGRYGELEPARVADGLAAELEAAARTFEAVPTAAHGNRGLRGDGAAFTVVTLTRYFAHETVHHLADARR